MARPRRSGARGLVFGDRNQNPEALPRSVSLLVYLKVGEFGIRQAKLEGSYGASDDPWPIFNVYGFSGKRDSTGKAPMWKRSITTSC